MPLQTQSTNLFLPNNPSVLHFNFGFSTAETNVSGSFPDSLSITFQTDDGLFTALLLAADASGVVWAPSNPGGLPVNSGDLARSAIPIPSFAQGYGSMFAYSVSFLIPTEFHGKPATLYFDLFDNLSPPNSLGWADNIANVPEPSIVTLAALGLAVLMVRRTHRQL